MALSTFGSSPDREFKWCWIWSCPLLLLYRACQGFSGCRKELEDLLDGLAGPFDDFAGSFCGAYGYVLACRSTAFPDSFGAGDGVKSNYVNSTLPGALSEVACTLTCAFPYITASTSYFSPGASALFLGSGLIGLLILSRGRLILGVGN